MLYDRIPERIKKDPDFIKSLNEGHIGDIKSQNVPRNSKFTYDVANKI